MSKTFKHNKCGEEVEAKRTVLEYCPIEEMESGWMDTGDVTATHIEDMVIWCENCCCEVEKQDVLVEGTD